MYLMLQSQSYRLNLLRRKKQPLMVQEIRRVPGGTKMLVNQRELNYKEETINIYYMNMNMKVTFDNVMERVINNRSLSRKEKLVELRKFLKEYSGANKPTEENEVAMLASLKTIKQS